MWKHRTDDVTYLETMLMDAVFGKLSRPNSQPVMTIFEQYGKLRSLWSALDLNIDFSSNRLSVLLRHRPSNQTLGILEEILHKKQKTNTASKLSC